MYHTIIRPLAEDGFVNTKIWLKDLKHPSHAVVWKQRGQVRLSRIYRHIG